MLERVTVDKSPVEVRIADAAYPVPFRPGLEYAAPARGTWNIAHTGMLLPQGHEIFVCAAGCLRGVVLTAAEMGASDRFSTIEVMENNVLEGDMERLIIDGVAAILSGLPKRPKAVLLYTSCIHHFMNCDLPLVYRELRRAHPDVAFTDCYMNPIMRKSGLTPDQLMRRQLYSLLETRSASPENVAIIGNDLATDETSELMALTGWNHRVFDIARMDTYAQYQMIATASLFLTTYPAAIPAGEMLAQRFGRPHIHLPMAFGYEALQQTIDRLADALGMPRVDHEAAQQECDEVLGALARRIRAAKIAIDYTAVTRPLGLARLLVEHGMRVARVYLDAVAPEEKQDFFWLRENAPEILLQPTVHPMMRVLPRNEGTDILAIGQKAAYFTGTDRFVNIVEGGGHWGYDGIRRLTGEMADAWENPKDAKSLIQIKGWGCGSCA